MSTPKSTGKALMAELDELVRSSRAVTQAERLQARARAWGTRGDYSNGTPGRRGAASHFRDQIIRAAVAGTALPEVTPELLLDLALMDSEHALCVRPASEAQRAQVLIEADKPFRAHGVLRDALDQYEARISAFYADLRGENPSNNTNTSDEPEKST